LVLAALGGLVGLVAWRIARAPAIRALPLPSSPARGSRRWPWRRHPRADARPRSPTARRAPDAPRGQAPARRDTRVARPRHRPRAARAERAAGSHVARTALRVRRAPATALGRDAPRSRRAPPRRVPPDDSRPAVH